MAMASYSKPRDFDWKDSEGFIYRRDKLTDQWWVEVGGCWYHYIKDFDRYSPPPDYYQKNYRSSKYDEVVGKYKDTIKFVPTGGFPSDSPYVFTHELKDASGDLIGYNYAGVEVYRHVSSSKKKEWEVVGAKTWGGAGAAGNVNYTFYSNTAITTTDHMPLTGKHPLDWLNNEINKVCRRAENELRAIR